MIIRAKKSTKFRIVDIKNKGDVLYKHKWYALKVSYLNVNGIINYIKMKMPFVRNIYKIDNIESDYKKINNDIIFIEVVLTPKNKKLILMYKYIFKFFPDNEQPAVIQDFKAFIASGAPSEETDQGDSATGVDSSNIITKKRVLVDVAAGDDIIINIGMFKGCSGVVKEVINEYIIAEIVAGFAANINSSSCIDNIITAEVSRTDIELINKAQIT